VSDLFPGARTRTLAIANQKGGVGKTTTAINLAAAFAERGLRVLVIDLDPQGNASTGLGVMRGERGLTSYDVLLDERPLSNAIVATSARSVWICPSTVDLSSADMELVANEKRAFLLHDAVRGLLLQDGTWDFILIDCPPSLNLLTLNALTAAQAVLIPLQAEFFALEGLSQLMLTIREVRASGNPGLRIEGVLLTMHDARNRLSQQVEADARGTLGSLVLRTVIPRNVRVSEAPSYAEPVISFDPTSKGSAAYRALAAELLERRGLAAPETARVTE
jgi:chromosome partitioning protein